LSNLSCTKVKLDILEDIDVGKITAA